MTDDRRSNSSPKKNPTFAISVFIVVWPCLAEGTALRRNGQPPSSSTGVANAQATHAGHVASGNR